ncbi:hypothetical protein AXF42_Ash015280 [Apostasia shenzhenica]|uniref:Uncharacterized protein n=1 Tax=Apostasia shenzhenica TaxID=1088818 RepID=A0A2I0ALS9_9ASPA|nr:hypothetical protein AXF42_Ash015280 [Apostasia shenzhenica]
MESTWFTAARFLPFSPENCGFSSSPPSSKCLSLRAWSLTSGSGCALSLNCRKVAGWRNGARYFLPSVDQSSINPRPPSTSSVNRENLAEAMLKHQQLDKILHHQQRRERDVVSCQPRKLTGKKSGAKLGRV